jgi:hypothetical protein
VQLLLGCGSNRQKKLWQDSPEWEGLVTLDIEARHNPDVLWDLNCPDPLPFAENSATEIHAYECMEHCGTQGDYRFFFRQWTDFWRVLIPGGLFFASVPLATSPWAWGDPSHTRIISQESLTFLNQPAYKQVGVSPMSDYRAIYRADFDIIHTNKTEHSLFFALRAVKPSRVDD